MDFDRTCIIKVSIAALETLVLKSICQTMLQIFFPPQEHKIKIVPEEKLPLSLDTIKIPSFKGKNLSFGNGS